MMITRFFNEIYGFWMVVFVQIPFRTWGVGPLLRMAGLRTDLLFYIGRNDQDSPTEPETHRNH